jgi:hypothetical protein
MKKRLRLLIIALAFVSTGTQQAFAQREQSVRSTDEARPRPKLYYKNSQKEVPQPRLAVRKTTLYYRNNKAKGLDFHIQNVDVKGLEISQQYWGAASKVLVVVVKNNGITESKEAYLAVLVNWAHSVVVTKPNPGFKEVVECIHAQGQVIPSLKAGQETFLMFDLRDVKNGSSNISDYLQTEQKETEKGVFGKPGQYWFECVLVTEPISVQ